MKTTLLTQKFRFLDKQLTLSGLLGTEFPNRFHRLRLLNIRCLAQNNDRRIFSLLLMSLRPGSICLAAE